MTVLLALLSAMQVLAYDTRGSDDPRLQMARGLFEKYVSLEHAYDARVADLYADEALIRNKRTYPNGQIREATFPAPQYRALIRTAMPLAKLKGDKSTYSKLTYTLEGWSQDQGRPVFGAEEVPQSDLTASEARSIRGVAHIRGSQRVAAMTGREK